MNDHETLGVPDNADDNQIRHRFRQLALQHHPDRGGDEETFKSMKAAYERLVKGGDKAEDSIIGQAIEMLRVCFSQLMDQCDPLVNDMVEVAKDSILQNIKDAKQTIEAADKKVSKLVLLKGRMKNKHQVNLFEMIVQERLQRLVDQTHALQKNIAVNEKMLELLEDYEFEHDEPASTGTIYIRSGAAVTGW